MRYFAYGSNLNLPHLSSWVRLFGVNPDEITNPRRAVLGDHQLRTNYLTTNGLGAANIEPAKGGAVEGLQLTITPAVHAALRAKEGHPIRYTEEEVLVTVPGRTRRVRALTYVVTPDHCLPVDMPVSDNYRRLVLDGARACRLSRIYQTRLLSILLTPRMLHDMMTDGRAHLRDADASDIQNGRWIA